MKREPKPEFYSYKIFPLFDWPKCCVCNQTFGFESGYEVCLPVTKSVCKKCCDGNQADADEILRRIKSNSRTKWPPPPPQQVPIQKRSNDITETNDSNYIIRKEIKCKESYLP